ncbi:unnamed protein product [Caenorhabditis brenneri]
MMQHPEMKEYSNEGVFRFETMVDLPIPHKHYFPKKVGNNNWKLRINRKFNKGTEYLGVLLKCNPRIFSTLWSCQATVGITLLNVNPEKNVVMNFDQKFDHFKKIDMEKFKDFTDVLNDGFVHKNNMLIFEVSIRVHDSVGFPILFRSMFEEPEQQERKKMYLIACNWLRLSNLRLSLQNASSFFGKTNLLIELTN